MIRSVVLTTSTATTTTLISSPSTAAAAAAAAATETKTSTTGSSTGTILLPSPPAGVDITHKVFMDVRVARTDGSTYIRDDLPDTFDNRVLFQRLQFGLFGNVAPNRVTQFLTYIVGGDPQKASSSAIKTNSGSSSSSTEQQQRQQLQAEYDFDNPFPSYSRSTFPAFDQETGLLMGGNIASLKLKSIGGGSPALVYGSRVLPAPLWIDSTTTITTATVDKLSSSTTTPTKLSHTTKGLLTHKNLDPLPNFGITTRPQPSLDSTSTVFGCVLWDDETFEFFRQLEDLPTYSVERPSGLDEFGTGGVTTNVFNAQREFFRGAAQTFGDDRVNKLYNGKLMRRMEVLQVGML